MSGERHGHCMLCVNPPLYSPPALNSVEIISRVKQANKSPLQICNLPWPIEWKFYEWSWLSWIRASWYNYESNQQDATIEINLLFLVSSTCFGQCFRPSSEALDCVFTVSGSIHTSCCRLVSWMSRNCFSIHPRHQQVATLVNTTWYCKYSQVFLMMGENIARNMESWPGIIN
jgi:hypothetical protein